MDEVKRTWTRWDSFLAGVIPKLDRMAEKVGALPGRYIKHRQGCGAGIFYLHGEDSWWGAWIEPGAFNARLGRVEIIVDRPCRSA